MLVIPIKSLRGFLAMREIIANAYLFIKFISALPLKPFYPTFACAFRGQWSDIQRQRYKDLLNNNESDSEKPQKI